MQLVININRIQSAGRIVDGSDDSKIHIKIKIGIRNETFVLAVAPRLRIVVPTVKSNDVRRFSFGIECVP